MKLDEIYQPIADDLGATEELLRSILSESVNGSILAMGIDLLEAGGKRMRPALVFLAERAACGAGARTCDHQELIEAAAVMELIHIASLIHDDVLDEATVRHNKPTINTRYGDDVSIVLGDYVYSKAFQLIGKRGRAELFSCLSEAIHAMCEGELIHICQRHNIDLTERNYIMIAQKKTASLFAASCRAGAIIGSQTESVQMALKEFGLNFGIAFQIMDDCRDVISEANELGKHPGQDMLAGDVTLPLLALSDSVGQAEREEIKNMLGSARDQSSLKRLKTMLLESDALSKTQDVVTSYANSARKRLDTLADSVYKESLSRLIDYATQNNF